MAGEFFPPKPEIAPTIYAYELPGVPSHKGYLKVGYTEQGADARVRQQLQTAGLADSDRAMTRHRSMAHSRRRWNRFICTSFSGSVGVSSCVFIL